MAITIYYKTVGVAAYGISNPVGARLYYCSNQRVQVTDEKTTNELYGPQDATQVGTDIGTNCVNILLPQMLSWIVHFNALVQSLSPDYSAD